MADHSVFQDRPTVTRKEAIASGSTRYFTGKPCAHGHVDYRYVSDSMCFECARQKAKRQKAKHGVRERHQANQNQKYRTDPAFRAKVIERSLQWGAEHREHRKAYMREYYAENRDALLAADRARRNTYAQDPEWIEKERARNRARHRKNPEAKRSYVRKRRAAIRGAEGSHNADDIARLLTKQGNRCAYCRASLKAGYEVDHIIPLSRGGSNWPSNLQCLCPTCNGRKWAKDPLDFARENGMLL